MVALADTFWKFQKKTDIVPSTQRVRGKISAIYKSTTSPLTRGLCLFIYNGDLDGFMRDRLYDVRVILTISEVVLGKKNSFSSIASVMNIYLNARSLTKFSAKFGGYAVISAFLLHTCKYDNLLQP